MLKMQIAISIRIFPFSFPNRWRKKEHKKCQTEFSHSELLSGRLTKFQIFRNSIRLHFNRKRIRQYAFKEWNRKAAERPCTMQTTNCDKFETHILMEFLIPRYYSTHISCNAASQFYEIWKSAKIGAVWKAQAKGSAFGHSPLKSSNCSYLSSCDRRKPQKRPGDSHSSDLL